MAAWLALFASLLLHGGQFLPPVVPAQPGIEPDPAAPAFTMPLTGPVLDFLPGRWEWWFDFNQDGVLDRRRRVAGARSADGSRGFEPVTDDMRRTLALPVLVQARHSGHRDVRAAALMALAQTALPEALPHLREGLADNDLFVRTQTAVALGFWGGPGVTEVLTAFLDRDGLSDEEVTFGLAGLALSDEVEAAEVLARRLRPARLAEDKNQVRGALVYAAGVSGHPELMQALLDLGSSWVFRKEADLRGLGAVALGQFARAEVQPALLALLGDADARVRRSAAAGLGAMASELDTRGRQELLVHFRGEGDLATRQRLLLALGRSGDPAALQLVRQRLQEGVTDTRPWAALALALGGDRDAVPLLLDAWSESKGASPRGAVAVALGLLGDERARPLLSGALLTEREPALLGYVALGLALLGGSEPSSAARLEALVGSSHDVELLRLATLSLALMGEQERVLRLAGSLSEAESSLDRAARLAGLGQAGDGRVLEVVTTIAGDDNQPAFVRAYALLAVGEMCDPRAESGTWRLSRNVELNHPVGFLMELYRLL